jgi:tetratricopeptide (TPR) repeat protein
MLKSDALIFLVNSMTRTELKAFRIASLRHKTVPGYLKLFDIISKNRSTGADSMRNQFISESIGKSFNTAVNYLYRIILDTLLELRREQDSYYALFNQIMKAKILFEKSLFEDSFDLLKKVIEDSKRLENYFALLLASRLELEYLLALNFPMVDEKTILYKHHRINEIISVIRKINEQSSLYELLKYRVAYFGNARSQQQIHQLNDLVVSEMSMMASSNLENFEIKKLHQLFQANYLISVGDYKSALRSYIELNTLFEKNMHLWDNPPIYYLLTLEGVLDSLRSIRNYEGMTYFIEQLKKLESPSVNFNANVNCLIFLYELFPKFDRGDFSGSAVHMEEFTETLYNKLHLLSLTRQAELCLYASLIFFGNKDFKRAHKYLNLIFFKVKNYFNLPLYRTIRLVNLMILREIGDLKLISYETRSIKREMKGFDKGYQIEKVMLSFLNKQNLPVRNRERNILWDEVSGELQLLGQNVFERQVLRIFDFTAWIESRIRRIPLSDVLSAKTASIIN